MLLDVFLKKPRIPLGCSALASKPCNSAIRPVISSPVSPISWVLTRESAVSEKSLSFFWLAAPYCKTIWELVRSIFSAKSLTIFCSSGERGVSSTCTGVAFLLSAMTFSSAAGSRVSVGAAGAESRVRVGATGAFRSSSLFRSAMVVCPFCIYFYFVRFWLFRMLSSTSMSVEISIASALYSASSRFSKAAAVVSALRRRSASIWAAFSPLTPCFSSSA